jgi:hypothetical protein
MAAVFSFVQSRSHSIMTIGDNHADDIACFPISGKARIRATGKTIPISKA